MKALVVEDSRLAREGLVRMLQQFPELALVGQADHPQTALQLINEHKPEVIFLDIHMPGESGFDLLEKLDYTPRIIFTTAYSEYAIRSFDYHAVDYLLKPISQERLEKAVQKLFATASEANVQPGLDINSQIFVKDEEQCHLVPLVSIRYIESCKNYVRIYFGDQKAFIKKSLNQVEARLPGRYFFRANRQFIVNLQAIVAIEEAISDGFLLTMNDGKEIEVSRRNALSLKNLLSL
jgi:two-component system LytT family response regulator